MKTAWTPRQILPKNQKHQNRQKQQPKTQVDNDKRFINYMDGITYFYILDFCMINVYNILLR